jgi:pyruvate/2-oxoglutarate dehydrogenase complex dihydrolipoamide dehydrogenase (E3) component
MTHVEALDLDRLPGHVIVLGGGYVGLELAQALRRFGSGVTVIERGSQIAAAEDADVAQALLENFASEGISFARAQVRFGRMFVWPQVMWNWKGFLSV